MRILSIETSTRRGSVALLENGVVVAANDYEADHGHAERCLPLVQETMAAAGWSRTSPERIAVGIGPGSFTGLRVGIALASGVALALRIPVLGVGSLAAMASVLSPKEFTHRAALLDARRGELFLAVYGPGGETIVEPCTIDRARAADYLRELATENRLGVVGEVARDLEIDRLAAPDADLPHARRTGLLAHLERDATVPATALYVRDADAILPNLPVSPLAQPRH